MLVGIQADDLTGACDTGAPFAARGLDTVVLVEDAAVPEPTPAVTVIDTESRNLEALEARGRARAAIRRLGATPARILYKKVDSTLRGALAAEVAGAVEAAEVAQVLLAPALPGQGRSVVDGVLRLAGERAEAGPLASDPGTPATGSSVLALLGVAGPHPVALVPLETVRRGVDAVAARLDRGGGCLVCDAETDDDLATIVGAALGRRALLAGSAGLAEAVASRLVGSAPRPLPPPRRPLLVVAGSVHPVTRAQVARLEARGVPAYRIGPDTGKPGDPQPEAHVGPEGLLLATVETPAGPREVVAAGLARLALGVLTPAPAGAREASGIPTLLLTGGDTAIAVCRILGATAIILEGELAPGLPSGRLRDGPFAGVAVITKAGGFGDPETLVRLWEASR